MISFELTDEQEKLQKKIRSLAKEKMRPLSFLLDKKQPGPIDKEYLKLIGEEKLNSFLIPEEFGGHMLDRLTLSLVAEELGYGCGGLACIYAETAAAVSALLIGGSQEQKETYLPPLLDSDGATAGYAATESKGGSDTKSFNTIARVEGDRYVLNGSKGPIFNAGNAAFYTIWVGSEVTAGLSGINTFVVPGDASGITCGPFDDKLGLRCAPTATVYLDNVSTPGSNLLGSPGSGYLLLMQTVDLGRALCGAICVGVARAALEEAIDFAKTRVIRNRPIIDNQGISFALAELATELDAARLLVWRANSLIVSGSDYTAESSMANLFASEVAVRTTDECVQFLGQKGVIYPNTMAKYQRDAQTLRIVVGTSQIQKGVIARQL